MKTGRNKVLTEEKINIICEAKADGKSDKEAYTLAGISKAVFFKEKAENKYFQDRLKIAENKFEEWRLNGLKQDALAGLKKLIQGGVYKTTKTIYENDGSGKPKIKQQIIEEKEVAPNATALIFALCNRDAENWKQRVETEIKGKLDTGEKPLDLSKVPTELLKEVAMHILDE